MLGAMMMFLQAQTGLGLDLDTLNLETTASINAVIPAPWAVYLAVQRVLFPTPGFELRHNGFDVLTARTVRYQHGISGFNDDQIFYAHHADQTTGRMHQRIARTCREHITDIAVAVAIFG